MDRSSAARSWREEHQREDGTYDAETWGEVDERGERVTSAASKHKCKAYPHGLLGASVYCNPTLCNCERPK